jgi:hypothetical protein
MNTRKTRMVTLVVAAGFAIAMAPTVGWSDTIIDTTEGPIIADYSTTGFWPEGQTFIVPQTDTLLKSLTYYVQGAGGASNVLLTIDLYDWDQPSFDTVGSSLWHGEGLFSDKNRGLGWVQSLTELTFSPNVLLEGGMDYAFVFNMYGTGNFVLAMSGYEGGEAIVNVANTGWQTWTVTDAPLKMTFATPVPEPETYAMMLAGLGLVATAVRRRRM